ncbi:hypothetical protein EV401DRAFT_1984930 [Pisolithus croceorrhizus]|nr:hypothetical protein EV401DRAFT_1984930 [Pisolithus croceorrhizus]
MNTLGITLPLWLACNEISSRLLRRLVRQWQDVRQWIIFFHDNIITQPDAELEHRVMCKTSILEYLGLLQHSWVMTWSRHIPADKDIMRVISSLWLLEIKDPLFSSWSSTYTQFHHQRDSAIFNSAILIAHELNIKVDWANIMEVFGNDYDYFAQTAVAHLRYELSQDPPDLECIAWDVHIISALALTANLHLALVKQGSLFICLDVLNLIVQESWDGENRKYAARCVVNATVYLKDGLEDLDGVPLVLTLLSMNLIPILLKCEQHLPLADSDPARNQPGQLLGRMLASYTIYRSVLKRVILLIEQVQEAGEDRHLQNGSSLYEDWHRLKDTVRERARMLRPDYPTPHAIQHCHNERCTRVDPLGSFRRCGGCLHSFYCSRECQRLDWQQGKHKAYCQRIQERYVRTGEGQMFMISCSDFRFFESVIIAELRRHQDRIIAHKLKVNVVEFDFTKGVTDIVFDSLRLDPKLFKILCPCEQFSHDRWESLLVRAKRSQQQLVLVRAYIPGGMSRKILLRGYELRRVLNNDWRVENKLVFPHRLCLTFTCCGRPSDTRLEGKDGKCLRERRTSRHT